MDNKNNNCIGRVACRVLRALIIRVTFLVHAFLTLWRVYLMNGKKMYWSLMLLLTLLPIETCITLKYKKGGEWTWFCPSFLFYLASVLPSIWLLELDRLHRHKNQPSLLNQTTLNITTTEVMNLTYTYHEDVTSYNESSDSKILDAIISPKLTQWISSGSLDPDTWVITLEQSMLYLLILGRWFLPRGKMTHDQLSQLLFVYIGMSSDIMELFYLFDEKVVVNHDFMGYVILAVWSLSLMQFTLILTAVSSKKRKVTHHTANFLTKIKTGCSCTHNELWAIIVTVLLQDAPFLTVRLYVALGLKVITYSLLFFTVKNIIVILLQVYRFFVVCFQKSDNRRSTKRILKESRNGRRPGSVPKDEYLPFYENPTIAAKHHLKAGVAPLANVEVSADTIENSFQNNQ